MSTCASFFGLLLHWSTVMYISKKSYFQVKSWTSAIDCISYHIALRYCSNRLCVLLLWIGTFPTLSPRGLNSSATFNSPLSIKKAEIFWTLFRTSHFKAWNFSKWLFRLSTRFHLGYLLFPFHSRRHSLFPWHREKYQWPSSAVVR